MDSGFKPILSPSEMTDFALDAFETKVTAPAAKTFCLALTAGAFIGIGMIFFLVSQQGITHPDGTAAMPIGMAKAIGGILFSVGLALVVLTGAELFTGSTMAVASLYEKRFNLGAMLEYWLVVYVGNLLGASTLSALMWFGGTWESSKGSLGLLALKTADAKAAHGFGQALVLGILCNILVCLAVWVGYAGRTVTDKILGLTLPIAMFVAAGFEHSVANMFLLPFATLIKTAAPASFWSDTQTTAAAFPHLDWGHIWTANLIPVTIGNIIGGGIMIGLFYTIVHKHMGARH